MNDNVSSPGRLSKKVGTCKCGELARPGQRTCLKCHAATSKVYRAEARRYIRELQVVIESLTSHNPGTEKLWQQLVGGCRHVIVQPDGEGEVLAGLVTAFLANGVVVITDYTGFQHQAHVSRLTPDKGRKDFW